MSRPEKDITGTLKIAINMQLMIVVADYSFKNISLQFEDGVYVDKKARHQFYNSRIAHPKINAHIEKNKLKYIGRINNTLCGRLIAITDLKDTHNINIQFEDGFIRQNESICMQDFNKKRIAHPNIPKKEYTDYSHIRQINNQKFNETKDRLTNKLFISKTHNLYMIQTYERADKLTVLFDNGLYKKTYKRECEINQSYPKNVGNIHLDEPAFFYNGQQYYICSCPTKWYKDKKILSIPQIYEITDSNRATAPREIS